MLLWICILKFKEKNTLGTQNSMNKGKDGLTMEFVEGTVNKLQDRNTFSYNKQETFLNSDLNIRILVEYV